MGSNVLFLFPGQGVQKVGMGRSLYERSTAVRELFELCADTTKKDVKKILFESEEAVLQQTDNTQIAMTLVSVSSALVLKERGIIPHIVAGFSLGEYAALVSANIIGYEDIFKIVVQRGMIMDAVSKKLATGSSTGSSSEAHMGMTALLGMHPKEIESQLGTMNIKEVYLAMHNSPVQGVIAGSQNAREEAVDTLKERGVKKAVPLKVSGPFHTPFMEEARLQFAEVIRDVDFKDPSIPIFNNVDGTAISKGSVMKEKCLEQIVSPVQWIDEEAQIIAHNPSKVLEVGVGTVLTGLWKAWKREQSDAHIVDCEATDGQFEKIESIGDI